MSMRAGNRQGVYANFPNGELPPKPALSAFIRSAGTRPARGTGNSAAKPMGPIPRVVLLKTRKPYAISERSVEIKSQLVER